VLVAEDVRGSHLLSAGGLELLDAGEHLAVDLHEARARAAKSTIALDQSAHLAEAGGGDGAQAPSSRAGGGEDPGGVGLPFAAVARGPAAPAPQEVEGAPGEGLAGEEDVEEAPRFLAEAHESLAQPAEPVAVGGGHLYV